VLFHHARRPIDLPRIGVRRGPGIRIDVPSRWLKGHPLTAHLLDKEAAEWAGAGHALRRRSDR